MTAIRNYNNNVPHVFRYPRWAPDVFYPSSSLVSFPFLDSDGITLRYNYYTSSKDIPAGNGSPYDNFDWLLVFDITEAQRVQRNDSDIYRAINNLDSDMAAALEIVRLQSDSDNILSVNEHDSDVAMIYHDFKAADSDILYLMERIRLQVDSDNIVKVSDYDSDRARETHDRKASDSDTSDRITELKLLDLFDVKERLPTTINVPAVPGSLVLNSGTYSYLEFDAFDNEAKQYGAGEYQNDGVVRVGTGVDAYTGLGLKFTGSIFISKTRITDVNFTNEYMVVVPYIIYGTVNALRGMKVLAATDLSFITGANTQSFPNKTLPADGVRSPKISGNWLPELNGLSGTNKFLGGGDILGSHQATYKLNFTPASTLTVGESRIVKQGSILRYDSDSEAWLPSDSLTNLESDLDSETLARKSADSDIRVTSLKNLDSEIKARKSADSDILYLMERIRLQVDSDNIVKVSDHDSDIAMIYHDFRSADSELNFITIGDVAEITQDMTGFVNRTHSALSWNNGTRTLTLSPVGSSYVVYRKGVSYTVLTPKSVTISNTGGGRYIKYDPITGQLYDYGVDGHPDFTNDILVAYVYWDTVTSRGIIVGDERHGAERDTTWHKAEHFNTGAVWRSGGAVAATLNDPSAIKIGMSNPIIIADEDIEHTIVNSASPSASYEQTLDPVAKIPVLWVNGDPGRYSQAWNNNDSEIIWLYGSNRAYYNPIDGSGVGTLAEADSGKFMNYWIIGTNDTRWPIKALIGQNTYNNHNDADAETFAKYDLPIPEMVPMYKVTLEIRNTYTQNPAKVRIHSVQLLSVNNNSVVNSFNTSNHNLLIGRGLDDAHPIKAITGLEARLKALENFDSDALNGTMYDYGTF